MWFPRVFLYQNSVSAQTVIISLLCVTYCALVLSSDTSPLLQLIEEWIKVTEHNRTDQVVDQSKVTIIWSIAVAIFCVGGMIGGAITGIVAERFGRKGGLLLNNVLVAVAAIFEGMKFKIVAISY
jgi:MFS family permease